MICPICNRCPFDKGVCEDRLNRGRRFFLMGALALPVARKLEALAPIVAPDLTRIVLYDSKRWTLTHNLLTGSIGVTRWELAT